MGQGTVSTKDVQSLFELNNLSIILACLAAMLFHVKHTRINVCLSLRCASNMMLRVRFSWSIPELELRDCPSLDDGRSALAFCELLSMFQRVWLVSVYIRKEASQLPNLGTNICIIRVECFECTRLGMWKKPSV